MKQFQKYVLYHGKFHGDVKIYTLIIMQAYRIKLLLNKDLIWDALRPTIFVSFHSIALLYLHNIIFTISIVKSWNLNKNWNVRLIELNGASCVVHVSYITWIFCSTEMHSDLYKANVSLIEWNMLNVWAFKFYYTMKIIFELVKKKEFKWNALTATP